MKAQQVLAAAEELYRENPDWLTFCREIFGVGGAVQLAFPKKTELRQFNDSPEAARLRDMLHDLRTRKCEDYQKEKTTVITVRLPESLHTELKREARQSNMSLNKLCLVRLSNEVMQPQIAS